MKTKFVTALIIIVFGIATFWLLKHSYVIITFWTGMLAIGIWVASVFAAFWIGRITKPKPKHSVNEYPPHAGD